VSPIRHQEISDCSDYAEVPDIWNRNPTITMSPPTYNNARQYRKRNTSGFELVSLCSSNPRCEANFATAAFLQNKQQAIHRHFSTITFAAVGYNTTEIF